jgi:hypothetical protein
MGDDPRGLAQKKRLASLFIDYLGKKFSILFPCGITGAFA